MEKHKQPALSLSIDQFKEMDALAIQNFSLPIELMMENAGLQLARLVSSNSTRKKNIWIGIGPGNNGGGGLAAARRLSGWGYRVKLDIPDRKLKYLPALQLKRALAAGAEIAPLSKSDLILTMAAPKTELIKFGHGPGLYVADIGIPGDLYEHFGIRQPDFDLSGILKYTDIQT